MVQIVFTYSRSQVFTHLYYWGLSSYSRCYVSLSEKGNNLYSSWKSVIRVKELKCAIRNFTMIRAKCLRKTICVLKAD